MGKIPPREPPRPEDFSVGAAPHGGTDALPGGQQLLIELASTHRTTTVVVGRSWGKTIACLLLLIYECVRTKGIYQAAYCAPTNRLARKMYRAFKAILGPLVKWHSDVDQILELHPLRGDGHDVNDGAIMDFWGLQAAEAKRGDRKHRIIVDECKDVLSRVISRVLRWMLLGRLGKILFIGTPGWTGVGARWFKREHDKGFDDSYPRHASMHGPSHGNPKLFEEDLEELIQDAEDEGESVEEEVYAKWLTGEGAVFRNLEATFDLDLPEGGERIPGTLWIFEDPDQGEPETAHDNSRLPDRYLMTCDFGETKDFTVSAIMNTRTKKMAALYRKRRIPYHQHLQQLHKLRTRYNDATVYLDAGGGHGGAIREWMAEKYGDGCMLIKWNTYSKQADITRGQQLCEHAGLEEEEVGPTWHLGRIPWLRAEFEAYQIVTESSTGQKLERPKFGAPPGFHDDGVTALLLLAKELLRTYVEKPLPRTPPEPDSDEALIDEMDQEEWLQASGEWVI